MCDHHVIESVKSRMLSRRALLGAGAVGVAASAAGCAAVAPAGPIVSSGGVLEMTHVYDENFPTYFGAPGISRSQPFNFAEHGVNLLELRLNEHTGTHMDAPLHFSADGASVDQIPVSRLVCPLAVVDIREKAAANADAQVTPDDLAAWVAANGPIPDGACVAMLSGWAERLGGPGFRNVGADEKMHFPGFHVEAAQMLIEGGAAVGIAVDTLSLDHGPSEDFATHYAWLPSGRWGLENVAGLAAAPARGATLIAGAPMHRGGTGGPTRVIALT